MEVRHRQPGRAGSDRSRLRCRAVRSHDDTRPSRPQPFVAGTRRLRSVMRRGTSVFRPPPPVASTGQGERSSGWTTRGTCSRPIHGGVVRRPRVRTLIGEATEGCRDERFIATKFGRRYLSDVRQQRL